MNNATETHLESHMRNGRTIITFRTDITPDMLAADPDALHRVHVERVRRHIEWMRLAPEYREDPEINMWFADHLPTGRVVGRDGTNYGTSTTPARDETRIRRKIARLEARQDVLIESFPAEKWAADELDDLRDEIGEASMDLVPYEQAKVRQRDARYRRRWRARRAGRLAPVPQFTEDEINRHKTLNDLKCPVRRGTMSDPIGAGRNLRQIAQVAA